MRTTDLARIDADGFVWILGRADQAIIRGGFKVRPDDVRAALERDPRVRGAAVVGRRRPPPRRGPGGRRRAAAHGRRRPTTSSTRLGRRARPLRAARPRSGSSTRCPAPDSGKVDLVRRARRLFARGAPDGPDLQRRGRGLPGRGPRRGSRRRCREHGPPPPPGDWPARRAYDTAWQRKLLRRRLRRAQLADGVRRPRPAGHPAARVPRGVRPGRRAVHRRELRRHDARRADAHRRGHRRAAALPPAPHPPRRRRLVPGLLRAGGRLRPRLAAHAGRARRRRVRRDRPEDLEHPGPRRRLVRAARAHRPRRAEAQGHHLADPRHAPAGRRGPADAHHRRREPLLRGVPRRRPGPGRRTGSARRTTGGGSPT